MNRKTIAAVILGVASLAACGRVTNPAAAVVDGHRITVEEIQHETDIFKDKADFQQLAQQGTPDEVTRLFEQNVLSSLIRRAVLEPKAEELGIEVTDADVDKRIEDIKSPYDTEAQFQEALQSQGLSMELLTSLVRDEALAQRLKAEVTKDVGPSDEDVQQYYDDHASDYAELHAQHILVDGKAQATRIAKQLQRSSGKKVDSLFARLARKFSTDTSSKSKGGDLGFLPENQLVPEFVQGAVELEKGEISDPIKSQFGFHVIRLLDRRVQPVDEVRSEIVSTLATDEQERAWTDWITRIYEDADIEVNPSYGELNPRTQQVTDATPAEIPGGATPASPSPNQTPE